MYPHQKLIADNGISAAALPADIQNVISTFDGILVAYKEALEENELEEAKELSAELSKLSAEIATEIKDHLDDETEEELSPSEMKEKVLEGFIAEGKLKVTIGELEKAGYPGAEKFSRSFSQSVGSFLLEKKLGDTYCYIKKAS